MIVENALAIDIDDETRHTVESAPGRPLTYRYFTGAIVTAITVHQSQPEEVGELVASLIDAYSSTAGFSRTMLRNVEVDNADEAVGCEMRWDSSDGIKMKSLIRVMSDGERAAVCNIAFPALLVDKLGPQAEHIIESAHLTPAA